MDERRVIDVGALVDGGGIGLAQWGIVGLCGLVAMLDGLDLQAIGLAAPAMIARLHIPPQGFGVVFSAALAGLAVGAALLGPAADRYGRKPVLIGATLCFGVFTLATAFADRLQLLLLVRFLAGVGLGGAMPSFISLVSEYIPDRLRVTMVSLLWAGFPLGGVIGGLLGSWLIPAYGWQAIFLVGGTLPLLVALLLLVALPESVSFLISRDAPAVRVAAVLRRVYPGMQISPTATFLRRETTRASAPVAQLFFGGRGFGTVLLWVSFFCIFMILVVNSSWTPTLLRVEGIPIERGAVALAAYNFGALFGSAVGGLLVSRLGANVVLPVALICGGIAYALVGSVVPSAAAVTWCQATFGLLLGCASAGLIALGALYYPVAIRSTGVGWATGIGRLGSFAGPLGVGWLVGQGWPTQVILDVVAVSTVIAAVAILMMGPGASGASRTPGGET
jgi:MFS transporter, AAHS family, 4-hydroxybenzoate transporter